MTAQTRRERPGPAAPSDDPHQTIGTREGITGVRHDRATITLDDRVSAAAELLDTLGPSASMALSVEFARLVVDVRPALAPPLRSLLAGVLS